MVSMASAFVFRCWIYLLLFLRDIILDFSKNVFLPLEPRLLVMWERIGEALQIVFEVLNSV